MQHDPSLPVSLLRPLPLPDSWVGPARSEESRWRRYSATEGGVDALLSSLDATRAAIALERLLGSRQTRVAALDQLVGLGVSDRFAGPNRLQRTNHWLIRHVSTADQEGRLAPLWYRVVNDVALLLGEELIDRSQGRIRWAYTAIASSDSKGVRTEPNLAILDGEPLGLTVNVPTDRSQGYHLPLDRLVAQYAEAVVMGHRVDPDYFLGLVLTAILDLRPFR